MLILCPFVLPDTLSSPALNYLQVNLFLQMVFLNSSISSSLLNFSLWKALVEVKTIVCENKMQYGILHWKLKYYFLKFSVKVLKSKTFILKISKESPRMLISLLLQQEQGMIPVLMGCDPMDYSPHAPLSMGLSRQEHWSALPFPPPGDLPNSGMEPMSLVSLVLTVGFFTMGHQGFW